MVLSIIDITFIFFTINTNILGILLNYFRSYAPICLYKATFYGSFAYKGPEAKSLRHLDVPKSYFSHFYIFSSILSCVSLIYMVLVYFLDFGVNEYVRIGLQAFVQDNKPVPVKTTLTAMGLLTIQCLKRLYETTHLQVFAKSSKMNIAHYVLGIVHYGFCVMSIIGKGPLFCGNQNRQEITWTDSHKVILPCTLLFLWATYEQHQSNIILANLRRNKETGSVITDTYGVPRGRLFEYVSSAHRLCEIVIYLALVLLLQTKTYVIIFVWVVSNQVQAAIGAHQWYKKTFKNYPEETYAIFPCLL